jgi:hypothetical protein
MPMPGRSVLYRRLWYIKKRNIKKINLFVRLSLILILLCPVLIYAWNSSFVIIEKFIGINPEQLLKNRITEQVAKAFADFEFDSVIDELKDETGKTVSVSANRAVLSGIETDLGRKLQENLREFVSQECPVIRIDRIKLDTIVEIGKNGENNAACKIGINYNLSVSAKYVSIISHKNISGFIPLYEKLYVASR